MNNKFLEKYGPWAVVTGASSGIGAEFVHQIAEKGLNIVLVARRRQQLEAVAHSIENKYKVETKIVEADLSKDGFQFDIFDAIKDLEVGLLVNNAGMNCEGQFYRGSLDRNLQMLQLNTKAPFILGYEFGKQFISRGKGGIIFTSSISAFSAHPFLSHYAATKAYILSLAESMNYEFKDKNVDVLALCPGMTKSEMTKGMKEGPMLMDVLPVVKTALDSLGHQAYVVPGFINKAQVFINSRLLNRNGAKNLTGAMLKKILPAASKKPKKQE
ncbi:MAG: SDR family NAD(P)-dependent oxidoreductase [Chitinophagales bacterium]|jgi:short-subunit dehydrogenase|nr:SDR family NAD(P)-dependent oxidoreductase [Chitinophagales bacterium]